MNEKRFIETGASEEAFAKKTLFNHDNDIRINFISSCVKLNSYQVLLKLRRVDRCLSAMIDYFLSDDIQKQYISQDGAQSKFKILEHSNVSQAPVCFKSTLQQTLVCYFHSLRQLQIESDNISYKTFVEIFQSRLDVFEKLCTYRNFAFNFAPSDNRHPMVTLQFLQANPANHVHEYLHLNLSSNPCAYLFARIFAGFVTHPRFFNFVSKMKRVEYFYILYFLAIYKSCDSISEIINKFTKILEVGLSSNIIPLQVNSITLFHGAIMRDFINKSHLKDLTLAQRLAHIIAYSGKDEIEVEAFKLFRLLVEKDLVGKSLIKEIEERFHLTELIVDRLSRPDVIVAIRLDAFFLFSILTKKQWIEAKYVLGEHLVRNISRYMKKEDFIPFNEQFFEIDSRLKTVWLAKVENKEIQWGTVIRDYSDLCNLLIQTPNTTIGKIFKGISNTNIPNLEFEFRMKNLQLSGETVNALIASGNPEKETDALKLLYLLIEKDMVDKSFIEELEERFRLSELILIRISRRAVLNEIRVDLLFLFSILIKKQWIETKYALGLDLVHDICELMSLGQSVCFKNQFFGTNSGKSGWLLKVENNEVQSGQVIKDHSQLCILLALAPNATLGELFTKISDTTNLEYEFHIKNLQLSGETVTTLIASGTSEKETDALRLLYLLIKKGIVGKSFIEELEERFKLTELILDRLSRCDVLGTIRVDLLFLFSILTKKQWIETKYALGLDLVRDLRALMSAAEIAFFQKEFLGISSGKSGWLFKVENNEVQWGQVIKDHSHFCILRTLAPKATFGELFARITHTTHLEYDFHIKDLQLSSETVTALIASGTSEKETDALKLLYLLIEKGIVGKSFIEELEERFKLTELILDRISCRDVLGPIRVDLFFLFSTLTKKQWIEIKYALGLALERDLRALMSAAQIGFFQKEFFGTGFFGIGGGKSGWLFKVENNELQWGQVIKDHSHLCTLRALAPKATLGQIFTLLSWQ